ncbi:Na+/H+ antiporter subunit E [Microbacterium gorillae]|uniref:Na+/H+ antiporter subunit E n=1 Tax=Microbacterium gorillae TaxID=1231063 RepID=UPI00058B3CE7|nr:Na+/H+ antiporter subunit E [Microbacterium gorillae]
MSAEPRSAWAALWRQLPFFLWLVLVWMLLWGQFTVLSALTGVIVAVFVTLVFRLPPAELSGRINFWYLLVLVVTFLAEVVWGSLVVAWHVLNPKRYPGTAVIRVPLTSDDDLIMTHVGVTASLIPGSLVLETDRDRRVLYLHVLGLREGADVQAQLEKQRQWVLKWERRIIRALGSREQNRAVREETA